MLFYDEPFAASARVRVQVNGFLLKENEGEAPDVDVDEEPGGELALDFDTISLSTVPGTVFLRRFFASELATSKGRDPVNYPLEGVTITVDGTEEQYTAVTDEMGNFRMDLAPVGRFFVHVNGHTVTEGMQEGELIEACFPKGPYYRSVGKPFEITAGVETNMPNIYLPLVKAGSLVPVSETEPTVIGFPLDVVDDFPEFSDVAITVPAGSLMADDGTQGGSVGIAGGSKSDGLH